MGGDWNPKLAFSLARANRQ